MLPTEKASGLIKYHTTDRMDLSINIDEDIYDWQYQQLCVLSDEDIKEGDWVYNSDNKVVYQMHKHGLPVINPANKKVIATTDKIVCGWREVGDGYSPKILHIPQIPESFLPIFVKAYNEGKMLTEVELEYEVIGTGKVHFPSLMGDMTEYCGIDRHILKTTESNEVIISLPLTLDNTKLTMNTSTFELESKIIQAFRQDNVRGNTIHFSWDRMSETPADYILKVITRNVANGQLFLLKMVKADTHNQCLLNMLDYIENDMSKEDTWEVEWVDVNNKKWTSHFVGKCETEVREKFYYDMTINSAITSINKLGDNSHLSKELLQVYEVTEETNKINKTHDVVLLALKFMQEDNTLSIKEVLDKSLAAWDIQIKVK